MSRLFFFVLIGQNTASSPISNSESLVSMAKKKPRSRYGDYCQTVKGDLYGVINVPVGNGKYKKRYKKVTSRTEARQWALGELDRIKHGSPDEKQFSTFIDLAEWYKRYYLNAPVFERGMKVEGVKDWKKSRAKLDRMSVYFGPKRLSNFNETDLRGYVTHRRATDHVTTATINRDLALMRAMFKKGHDVTPSLIVPKFPINTKAEVERERVMTIDEETRILAACGDTEPLEYVRKGQKVKAEHKTNREHLKAIVILAVDTAMRSAEMFSLVWSDIDFDKGIITIRAQNSKTGKGRKVGMTPRVKQELSAIKGKGKVFQITSARKAFATACRRAEITDLHFHDLRHTATTRMIRAGIPHAEVMKITGHTQIKTFLRYLNLGNETVQNTANMLAEYLEKA